jgi:hypothetical protein
VQQVEQARIIVGSNGTEMKGGAVAKHDVSAVLELWTTGRHDWRLEL